MHFLLTTKQLLVAMALTILAACGGGGSGSSTPVSVQSTGTVTGKALDASTGAGIAGANVSYSSLSTTTAADGTFTLNAAPISTNAVIKIEKPNYAIGFATTAIEKDKVSNTQATLSKIAISAPIGIANGGTVKDPNSAAQVTLPANGLVDATGAQATGNVTVNLSVIDPKSNAAAMPGDYTTSAGTVIESFGAIKVTLLSSSGSTLNLGAGKTATIRIPVSSANTPDATIPLFYFNEITGKWVQEGTATLQGTSPSQYYEGTVTHFTYWNADKPAEIIYVNGCVKDAAGLPVANVKVQSSGIDYTNISEAMTDATGAFKVRMKKGGKASIYATLGSNTMVAGPSTTDITLSACLNLAMSAAPVILAQPVNTTMVSGAFDLLSVSAAPTGLRYQWYRNGALIANAISAQLYLNTTAFANGDTFYVVVSNNAGSVTSQTVTLTITLPPPAIITIYQQPVSVVATVGGVASFSVSAEINNSSALSYQWRKNDSNISGATNATYTTSALTSGDNGAVFSVVISSGNTSLTSSTATLTVNQVASVLTPLEQMRTIKVWITSSEAVTKPLQDVIDYGTPLTETLVQGQPCSSGMQITRIDGAAVVPTLLPGTAVPAGSHTLSVTSTNCQNDYLENGVSSLAYSFSNSNGSVLNGSATATVTNYLINLAGYFDYTLNGSGSLLVQTTKTSNGVSSTFDPVNINQTITFTPAANTTSRDNTNARTYTYSSGNTVDNKTKTRIASNTTETTSTVFNDLTYSFNSDVFKLTGTIGSTETWSNSGGAGTESYSGQINVFRNGVLVGFVKHYTTGTMKGELYINIGGVITPFF